MDTLSRMSIVNGADLQALALVFGQVTSRGALFGQDALQLINNNIPLTTILARHFGISMQEASEKINGGKVKAEEFVKAMENYAASLDIGQMTDTFQNRMISLSGTIRSVGLEILGIKIDPIKGMVIEAGGLFDQMSNRVTETTKLIKEHREEIVKVVTFVLQNAVPALKVLIGMYVAAKAAALGFKTAVAVSDISIDRWRTGLDGLGGSRRLRLRLRCWRRRRRRRRRWSLRRRGFRRSGSWSGLRRR